MNKSIEPSNLDAEKYILSLIIRSSEMRDEYLPYISEDDFAFYENKIIFREVLSLLEKNVLSIDILAAALRRAGRLDEAGGPAYLSELAYIGNSADAAYYFTELKTSTINREIAIITKEGFDRVLAGKGGEELALNLSRRLADLTTGLHQNIITISDMIHDYQDGKPYVQVLGDRMEKARVQGSAFDGISSGFPKLDAVVTGFANSSLTIVGARTSMGKTTLLLNLVFNISEQTPGTVIGFFSLEMPPKKLKEKMICTLLGIDYKRVKKGQISDAEYSRIEEFMPIFEDRYRVVFADEPGITIQNLRAMSRRLVLKHKINILFVDYLTLVQNDQSLSNKHLEINAVSKGLQSLARELQIPIVCLAQLNRALTARNDKTPMLSDLRESGSIEEDADVVLLLHRPKMFMKNDPGKEDVTEIRVAKNRDDGDLATLEYRFENGRLIELDTITELMAAQVYAADAAPPKNRDRPEEPAQRYWFDKED